MSNTAGDIGAAINLLAALAAATEEVSTLIQQAHAQGRQALTAEEWANLNAQADAAHAALERALGRQAAAVIPTAPSGGA